MAKTKQISPLERLAQAAKAANVPQDQLENFLRAGYIPQPKQLLFHGQCRAADRADGPEKIGFGGARGPGKTTGSFAQVLLDDCQRREDLKFLFLRKVAKAAKESVEDLRRKLLTHTPHDYKSQQGIIEIRRTGSRVFIGHFAHEKDIDAYLGLEYDGIAIEEDTQLSARKKQDILTCLRTSKPNWRPRSYHTTNPGGIDHAGFKREFIQPWRKGEELYTRFIPATVYDNQFVDRDYKGKLERLTGWQRKAWLEGDWDIAAGQFFSTFRHDLHVIEPFEIPVWWPVWAAMDYGFNHPTVVYLLTENDGVVYVIAEYWERKKLPSYHTEQIRGMLQKHERFKSFSNSGVNLFDLLNNFVAGRDAFAQKGDQQGKAISDQYADYGISLSPANMDRISGWSAILELLGDAELDPPLPPRLQIFNTCTRLIECLPALQHDANRPEDVLKVDIDDDGNGGDDPGDTLRYGIMARPSSVQGGYATAGERR